MQSHGEGNRVTLIFTRYTDHYRITCLCFILSRIVSFDNEVPCTNRDILEKLPLISSKTLWEARS